jgi:hypothetical protein
MNWIYKYKIVMLVAASIVLPQISFSQIQAVRFEKLDNLQKTEKRPIVVFLPTSWCKVAAL